MKMESGECFPRKAYWESVTEAWLTTHNQAWCCAPAQLCKRWGCWRSLAPQGQLSRHMQPRSPRLWRLFLIQDKQKSHTHKYSKILWGFPLAKCKYKKVTTCPSSTNFIILLRQPVKYLGRAGFISLSLYILIMFPIVFFMFTDSLFAS